VDGPGKSIGGVARRFTSQNLFTSPTQRASAWVQRYSVSAPARKEDRIETGHGFGRLAVDGDAIWATNAASETVMRIDGRSGRVDSLAKLHRAPAAIAVGTEAIWVVCGNGWLWRFDRGGEGEGVARLGRGARGLACDRQSVWVLRGGGELVGVDQVTGETAVGTKLRRDGGQLLHADGVLLALTGHGSRVCRIDPAGGRIEAEAELPHRGVRAAVLDGTLWVACGRRLSSRWGALVPVDTKTMAVGEPRPLPNAPRALTAAAGHLWVACGKRGDRKSSIVRVDVDSSEVTPWAESDWTIYDLAVAGDHLLAAAGLALAGPAAGLTDGGGGAGGGHHGGGHGGGGGGEGGGGH
jgi:sugar lactone lactonase YvrE